MEKMLYAVMAYTNGRYEFVKEVTAKCCESNESNSQAMNKEIGKRVAVIRKLARERQESVAKYLNMTRPNYTKKEIGITAFSAYELAELSKHFDVDCHYLITGVKESEQINIPTETSPRKKKILLMENQEDAESVVNDLQAYDVRAFVAIVPSYYADLENV